MAQIFPSTPQPFRAARIEGVDRQLLVNPMKGSGLDDILKHQLGMERDKNKHELAMQKSMFDMVTKFRPGGTKGNSVMGWHNPHQKKILEQADDAMYGAINMLLQTDKPTTQDVLKMQRQVGEATTRSVEKVAYEQATHVKYREKYNKDKDNYHAGAYNAALEEYYNYDGEEQFDLRKLDPSNYTYDNPYDVANQYLKRVKDNPSEALKMDETGTRYVEEKVTNIKAGMRDEIMRRSGKSLGWDYDYMSDEEKAQIATLYPDKESYVKGMVESIVSTAAPEDEYTGISDVHYPKQASVQRDEDPYTKTDRGKIETIKSHAEELGYTLDDNDARALHDEIMRFGKQDRFQNKTLGELVGIVINKDTAKYKATEKGAKKSESGTQSKKAEATMKAVKKYVYEPAPGGLSYAKKYRSTMDELGSSFEYKGKEVEYDYPINPAIFLAAPYEPAKMDGIEVTESDKENIKGFVTRGQTALARNPVNINDDKLYKKFMYFMQNDDDADAVVERRYGKFLQAVEKAKIKDVTKALWLFNWYLGNEKKAIEHMTKGLADPKGLRLN
jgi:hypothetical protein